MEDKPMVNLNNSSYWFRFVLLGEAKVGKTAILARFAENTFRNEQFTIIDVDYRIKKIQNEGLTINLIVWDLIRGCDRTIPVTRSAYKGKVCAMIVYDVSKRESFNKVNSWIQETLKYSIENISFVLVGNKCDLEPKQKQVSYEEGNALALENKMMFFEVSAKTGEGIEQMFRESTQLILDKIKSGQIDINQETYGILLGGQLAQKQMDFQLHGESEQVNNSCF